MEDWGSRWNKVLDRLRSRKMPHRMWTGTILSLRIEPTSMMRKLAQRVVWSAVIPFVLLPMALLSQTDCEAGNGPLDSAPPKTASVEEVIQKLGAAEATAKEARLHYAYKQDVLMQTLAGKDVTGEF